MLETRFQCWLLVISAIFCSVQGAVTYYGKYIGPLKGYHHSVQGEVYAVDARTLHIKDFTYDGQGPAAFFWVGSSSQPDASGYALRDERQSTVELKSYRKKSVTLTLPEGKSLNQIKWFSVWCESAAVNFGDIRIPKGFDFPRPQKIGQLGGVHGVSSDPIVIVDAQTLLIPNFSYDGEAPDAKFWVGTGPHPSPQGVRVPDENGKEEPLRRYNRKTIVLTLPGELTVFEIGHFGVWCEAFTVDFGHIQIPANLNMPPSLKMLGVSPQTNLVGQNVVNKIIEKVNVLFSIDPSPSNAYQQQSAASQLYGTANRYQQPYQQPVPSALNQKYTVTAKEAYQPTPKETYQPTPTIFHSFQQQYQYQVPQQGQSHQQQSQSPYIPALQNQFLQPTIYTQPAYSQKQQINLPQSNSQEQSRKGKPNDSPRPFTTSVPEAPTFVPSLSTFPPTGQSQSSLSYPFNLQNPQAILINQQYHQGRAPPVEEQPVLSSAQDVQRLLASLPTNPHRFEPVNTQQKTQQTQKEDKVTTYKPPTLDIHRFITKQQTVPKNKRYSYNNRNDNVQIVQSISYDQAFEPSDVQETVVASLEDIKNDLPPENENQTKRETRKTKIEEKSGDQTSRKIRKEKKEDTTEVAKAEEDQIQHATPYISDPKIELRQALIYDPVSRTYKEENLFYKENSKGKYERYESKKQQEETKKENDNTKSSPPKQRKRINRRIYTEDIEEINDEYNKYLPEVNDKLQDISAENNSPNDEVTKRYVQNGYLDGRYNAHEKYNTDENSYLSPGYSTAINKENKKAIINSRIITNKKPNVEYTRSRQIMTEGPTPLYDDQNNPDGDFNDAISYKNEGHTKQNRQTNSDLAEQARYYNTQSPNSYSDQDVKTNGYKPPRVLTEEYFNAKPTEITRPNKFNDEGIIQKLPLEKEIHFNIPPNRVNNFPETGKSVVYYPNYAREGVTSVGQYYEPKKTYDFQKDELKSSNDDYSEPPTNTDYYYQPQQLTNDNTQNTQESDYQQRTPISYQQKPQLVLGYKSPNSPKKQEDYRKSNTYEPQNPKASPDYYHYSDTNEPLYDDGKDVQYNDYRSTLPKEQATPLNYVKSSEAYKNPKYTPDKYVPPTAAPVDYYEQPKQQAYYQNANSQSESYNDGNQEDRTESRVKSTPEPYYQDNQNENPQPYEPPSYQQQTPSQVSSENYSEDLKANYDYYDKTADQKPYRGTNYQNSGEKTKELSEQYYRQFRTEDDEPSVTKPNDYLRYEVKDDIIKKYYYANDDSRLRAAPAREKTTEPAPPSTGLKEYYNTESEPSTSTEIDGGFDKINVNSESTPKYHFESRPTPPMPQYDDIPASAAMTSDALFNVYKQKQLNIQEQNLENQEKAHKEREAMIQQQVYEKFKRQKAVTTIPPDAVPHLKTPVNVEITSY
uniref:Protein Skeletor, isoforms D/E n=1 Tax=Cacopsylla melanoneura TaxID=428564 RepID=A0A8D8LP46_9HEMI